ncbi:MAG: hypothetical protein ACR2RF_25910 [Geminicoccaceae bacterium]
MTDIILPTSPMSFPKHGERRARFAHPAPLSTGGQRPQPPIAFTVAFSRRRILLDA